MEVLLKVKLLAGGLDSTIVGVLVVCLLPYVWTALAKTLGGFKPTDNQNPREFLAKTTGIASRANAAQANSFESLPIFVAGVLLSMYCFVPQVAVNGMVWLYVLLRLAYGVAYLANWATLRSILWTASMAVVISMFLFSLKMIL